MNNEFSLSDAREARLDRAIDRAVREMMQVDPPPGLDRRVLSRLNGPAARRPVRLPLYALAAAAVVVFILSGTLIRDVEPPPPPAAPSIVATGIPLVEAEAVMAAQPKVSTSTPGFTRERIPMPRVPNVFGSRGSQVSAASERGSATRGESHVAARPLAPKGLAPLRIVPLSARPIVVERFVIAGPPKN
jgi:hypothetical protein